VGGVDRLFEIGKNFRNEGLSRRHNPEFTMLEAYQAFGDYESMMETVESLICHVAKEVLGTLQVRHDQKAFLKKVLEETARKINRFTGEAMVGFLKTKNQSAIAASPMVGEVLTQFESLIASLDSTDAKTVARKAEGLLMAFAVHSGLVNRADTLSEPINNEAMAKMMKPIMDIVLPKMRQVVTHGDVQVIDLGTPWRRVRYKDLVREVAGQDWFDITPSERRRRAIEDLKLAGDIADGYEDFEVTGAVFEKLVEPTLIQPTFVTHLPKELVPLAKLSPDDPTTVEVFECCINGQEIAPGYTEQNDPIAQRNTLEHQAGGEQQKLDEDFLVALEHGMPPAGGIGIGIDRLCMMLLGQESIRDVILFPQMRPK
jgi:lysyl-tRNA synthetase class II